MGKKPGELTGHLQASIEKYREREGNAKKDDPVTEKEFMTICEMEKPLSKSDIAKTNAQNKPTESGTMAYDIYHAIFIAIVSFIFMFYGSLYFVFND